MHDASRWEPLVDESTHPLPVDRVALAPTPERRVGVATLYVTHDQVEAITMGDRVAVLSGGVLQQCDSPRVLYENPKNLFVASFMGSPAMNLFEARISNDASSVLIGSQTIALPPAVLLV